MQLRVQQPQVAQLHAQLLRDRVLVRLQQIQARIKSPMN